jgi:hypothetical protein
VDEVLKMPVTRMFLMRDSARTLKNQEYAELCTVSRSAALTHDGYMSLLNHYVDQMNSVDAPPAPKQPPLKGEMARQAVMGLFSTHPMSRRVH